jgi:hypothetical protein
VLDETLLGLIAQQMLGSDTIDVQGMHVPVIPTSTLHLKIARFEWTGGNIWPSNKTHTKGAGGDNWRRADIASYSSRIETTAT